MVRRRDPYNVLNEEIKSVGKRIKNVIERIPWIELMQIILDFSPSTECMYFNCCTFFESLQTQQIVDN